jgi:hypothetical protein
LVPSRLACGVQLQLCRSGCAACLVGWPPTRAALRASHHPIAALRAGPAAFACPQVCQGQQPQGAQRVPQEHGALHEVVSWQQYSSIVIPAMQQFSSTVWCAVDASELEPW